MNRCCVNRRRVNRRRANRRRSSRLLAYLLLFFAFSMAACDRESDGTTPIAAEQLPSLSLRDDTPDLLFTWMDERGGTHTGVAIDEVPETSRDMVRVVTKDAGHGSLFYVADLRKKNADGDYSVKTVPRSEWEGILRKRREAYRAKHAPPPPPRSSAAPAPSAEPPRAAALQATVYGASWCKPCKQAKSYLKRRGIHVTEVDIERQPRFAAEMQRKLKKAGRSGGTIPVIDVGGVIVVGFSPRALDQAIKKAKSRTAI
jgi:glutaredoxin